MQPEATEIPIPRCPFCSAPLNTVGTYMWQNPGGLIFAAYCGAAQCNKALSFQLLPVVHHAPDALTGLES